MGYDIFSIERDAASAEAHARKFMREGVFSSFDEAGVFIGSDALYFRLNMWGMGTLRRILYDLGVTQLALYEALADNGGNEISPELCLEVAAILRAQPDDKVKSVAAKCYVDAIESYRAFGHGNEKTPSPTDEMVEKESEEWLSYVNEWTEFLEGSAKLGGAIVL